MPDVPNLDCDDVDLMGFWSKHQSGRRARELFPNGGAKTRTATADLANYASNLWTARACRTRGDIQGAQMYESICERIYSTLPDFAKW